MRAPVYACADHAADVRFGFLAAVAARFDDQEAAAFGKGGDARTALDRLIASYIGRRSPRLRRDPAQAARERRRRRHRRRRTTAGRAPCTAAAGTSCTSASSRMTQVPSVPVTARATLKSVPGSRIRALRSRRPAAGFSGSAPRPARRSGRAARPARGRCRRGGRFRRATRSSRGVGPSSSCSPP